MAHSGAGHRSLEFKDALTWTVGKAIAVSELHRRLKSLAEELAKFDQEEIETKQVTQLADECASQNLLYHKDKGVRAWVACCLVELLRISAPNVPFENNKQLKDVYTLFVTSIIPSIANQNDAYHPQHVHVLQSLSTYKSILCILDIHSPNSLIIRLFKECFDVLAAAGDEVTKTLELSTTELLTTLVEEGQTLPVEAVDILLAQFLRAGAWTLKAKPNSASQSTLQLSSLSPAYHVAKNVCNSTVERMARYVSQYFSNVILGASSLQSGKARRRYKKGQTQSINEDEEEKESQEEPSEEDLAELAKAHNLVRELWLSSPGVLQNVIPQLEAELSTENDDVRILATQTLGNMAAGIGEGTQSPAEGATSSLNGSSDSKSEATHSTTSASVSFPHSYISAFQAFLGRRKDKSLLVRSAWTLAMGHILNTSAGGTGLSVQEQRDFAGHLSQMLCDQEEKVRLSAVHAVALFDIQNFVSKLLLLGGADDEGSLLKRLADRVKDVKPIVRSEAILLLGKLAGAVLGEIEAGQDDLCSLCGQLTSSIFETVFVNDPEINTLVYQVLFEFLIPLGYPVGKRKEGKKDDEKLTNDAADTARVRRMLLLVRDLNERAKGVFYLLAGRPLAESKAVKAFIIFCEKYNGGVMDENDKAIKSNLGQLITYLSKLFPDTARASEDLWKFAKMHDKRLYSLIRFCIAEDSDYQKVYKSIKEIKKKLDNRPQVGASLPLTLQRILYRFSNLIYNRSHVHPIMELTRRSDSNINLAANDVLKDISAKSPGLFRVHGEELCRILQDSAPTSDQSSNEESVNTLKACATFAHRYADEIPKDRRFMIAITQHALYGTPAIAGKYAITILLSNTSKRGTTARDTLRKCLKDLEYGSDFFLTRLATISQLLLLAADDFSSGDEIDIVTDFAINDILSQTRHSGSQPNQEWSDEMDEECQAKVWALRILVNRQRSYENGEAVRESIPPVLKLMEVLLENDGELNKDNETPAHHRSRLRLEAAILFVKLCANPGFDHFLNPAVFNSLALVTQSRSLAVRDAFVTKIKKYLGQNKLFPRFFTPLFLLAYEPNGKIRQETVTWLRARAIAFSKARQHTMEATFARFFSLLAHHPDFTEEADDIEYCIQYFVFYLKIVANEQNLPLLYHIAQRMKSVQDAIDPDFNEKLYILSDLAQAVIIQFAEVHNWTLQAYSGKASLPRDLYAALPNHEAAQEIATKQYLSEDIVDDIANIVKSKLKPSKKRKSESGSAGQTKRRATSIEGDANEEVGEKKALPIRKAGNSKYPAGSTKMLKTKKARATPSVTSSSPAASRRSERKAVPRKSYVEDDEDEDDVEMDKWNIPDDEAAGGSNKENSNLAV